MLINIPPFPAEPDASLHLIQFEADIYQLKRTFEKNSPAIIIQRHYRGFKSRMGILNQMKSKIQSIYNIQRHIRGFLCRKRLKEQLYKLLEEDNMQGLMVTYKELQMKRAARVIQVHWRFHRKNRNVNNLLVRSCITIQKNFKSKIHREYGFVESYQLDQYPRLYFLKEQKQQFFMIMKTLA